MVLFFVQNFDKGESLTDNGKVPMNSNDDRALQDRKKGEVSEDRFHSLLSSDPTLVPDWILGVMPGSREDDEKGIDFYVLTGDSQSIPVNVKSSLVGRKGFKRKYSLRDVCLIVMREEFDDDRMRKKVIEILERWKAQLP